MNHLFKRSLIISCAVFAMILLGIVVLFTWRQDIAFRLKTDAQAVFAPKLLLSESETETTQLSLEDLQNDPRVSFDQSLLLINENYMLADDFDADIDTYRDTDILMNRCMQDAYMALAEHISDTFGQKLYIRSAFRSAQEQQDEAESNSETATKVGASEHQAGLALDVYVPYYAGNAFLKTDVGIYVNEHCHEYGFIIRYPSYGKSETGIPFEPWHLRYVSFPHAEIIAKHYLTLEEYIDALEYGKLYAYSSYVISKQKGTNFTIPAEFQSAVVSCDNTGSYILTFQLL